MTRYDDATPIRPDGLVERLDGSGIVYPPTSYAPAVARLRRGLPAAPPDRRTRPRLPGEPWRGRLIDRRR
jgi:hypothetical protein